ncbi:MAG: type II CAAX endopeptidase family protein [Gammaproteobacteria bacterium]|nr:type II CAAX endopeptidase family protein [Gammaproteobacteria bacterium]
MPKFEAIYKPIKFFLLTFILTWVFWFLATFFCQNQNIKMLFMLLGLIVPFSTALFLIFCSDNTGIKKLFLNKLFNLRLIKVSYIPAIIFVPLLSIVIAILISIFFGFPLDQFTISKSFSFHIGTMPTLLVLFLAASFEELGWRGYAVESLNESLNYFNATAIFAVLWSLWHFPLFFISQTYQSDILHLNIWYAVNFMLSIIPLAFIISWICKKNSSSIPAAILLHFGINISQELFMVNPTTKCIQTFVLIIFSVIIVLMNKKMFFEKN